MKIYYLGMIHVPNKSLLSSLHRIVSSCINFYDIYINLVLKERLLLL